MRVFPALQYLLAFISVFSLSWVTKAQTVPLIFYPFSSEAGDTVYTAEDNENSTVINLQSPFVFFGRTYNKIYVNINGYLTFNQPSSDYTVHYFPTNGSEDIIAPLWTNADVSGNDIISYQQYSSGDVLTRATQDINHYFPNPSFVATWVLVVTWDQVEYTYQSNAATLFQVVLVSGSDVSFILMNYGDCALTQNMVQAGYDTINSTAYYVIPGSNNGTLIPNLMNSSNVNVPGRWAFRVNGGPNLQENVMGIQMRVTSFSDLTQTENIKIFLEELQQELVKYGLPDSVKLNLRAIKRAQP
ncbi:sushi, nidogen and EGF-like domain-containing protein 1 [Danio aesculapii]|uniref:sushi, nidogen and EGF-like domain-containing protein 1 n=1 Tax=Danio aesculapii TaxID=1142201 RepID=UPI0024BF4C16|nr:sushi, nidogen and EGF-like domain-containing protein 1 [Danio aesculapii]